MDSPCLDPYRLLGVSQDSTPEEIRAAYMELALLVHPDKGGSSDDMIVVHNAYRFAMDSAKYTREKSRLSYEEAEAEFAAFCKQQEDTPPDLADVLEEIRADANAGVAKFNALFDEEVKRANACTAFAEEPDGLSELFRPMTGMSEETVPDAIAMLQGNKPAWCARCENDNSDIPAKVAQLERERADLEEPVQQWPTELIQYQEPSAYVGDPWAHGTGPSQYRAAFSQPLFLEETIRPAHSVSGGLEPLPDLEAKRQSDYDSLCKQQTKDAGPQLLRDLSQRLYWVPLTPPTERPRVSV